MKWIKENAFDKIQITDVYYSGTKKDWDKIIIDSGNDLLYDATIHFEWVSPIGDVNGDNLFNVADIVMMQNWLLGKGTLTCWQAGDICEDGIIDIFDLSLMKRMLIGNYTSIPGDVNGDGQLTIADVIMLQKYLLGKDELTIWQNADLCKDNRIDVFDLVMIKRALLDN